MASHVVVIDTTARSVKIKTTPDKHITDVLEEACLKLGRDASKFGLKHNNKNIDLSRSIRLSGLSSGARLELVASSKSPSVVSVALQLQSQEPDGTSRLTDKFSSNTTLWQILRKHESAGGSNRNFTGRGVPTMSSDASGQGRLYFETPVIQIMGRELASFTDLQKTLAQLGFNSGSTLLRLSFRQTETPLEEAMAQIGQYFKELEAPTTSENVASDVQDSRATDTKIQAETNKDDPSPDAQVTTSIENQQSSTTPPGDTAADVDAAPADQAKESQTISGPSERPISVFAAPSSSTPKAAQQTFDERDFEPTVDHAKLHQQRLKTSGQNQRLLTDAELSAQAEAKAQRTAQVREVIIKVRFPDQSQVEAPFTSHDTAQNLYEHVKGLMQRPSEPFSLRFSTAKGPKLIPSSSDTRLITGLGMEGRVLVNFVWEQGASSQSRTNPTLKEQYRRRAQELQVKQIEGVEVDSRQPNKTKPTEAGGKEKKGGIPKWLKLPGKK